MNPEWYYKEEQIGVDYLDREIAAEYDNKHQQFRNFKVEADDVIDKLDISKNDVVVDFGCGTGGIALNLARYCKKVICVDISESMLAVLKGNADKNNIKNIETHCAGFLSYQHEGRPVDKIVSKVALHHLPDFWKSVALLKMAEILKTGGKLYLFDVVFTFDPKDYERSISDMIKTFQSMGGDPMAAETIIHLRDEYSTYDWVMDGLFEKTGFNVDQKIIEAENHVTYVCLKL